MNMSRRGWGVLLAVVLAGCGASESTLPSVDLPSEAPASTTVDSPRTVDAVAAPSTTSRGRVDIPIANEPLQPAAEWRRAAASPLSPRNQAIGVWTGGEVIVFGGTQRPMCPACDWAVPPERLRDGAAYNPQTNTWRAIAPLPLDAAGYGQAIRVGDDVFFLTRAVVGREVRFGLWSYSLTGDAWRAVALPAPRSTSPAMVEHRGRLVIYERSLERGRTPDIVFDQATGTWNELTTDPLDGAYDRQLVSVDGSLVLFAKLIGEASDSRRPGIVRAVVFDDVARRWDPLPDLAQLVPPLFADGSLAVSPRQGGADGGQNQWGRMVPNGGLLDVATRQWSPLPGSVTKQQEGGGAVGRFAAAFTSSRGQVLDLVSGKWFTIPTLPDGLEFAYEQTIVAADANLFVFGGGADFKVNNQTFVWETGRRLATQG
jgi:hypothetical protein